MMSPGISKRLVCWLTPVFITNIPTSLIHNMDTFHGCSY